MRSNFGVNFEEFKKDFPKRTLAIPAKPDVTTTA